MRCQNLREGGEVLGTKGSGNTGTFVVHGGIEPKIN